MFSFFLRNAGKSILFDEQEILKPFSAKNLKMHGLDPSLLPKIVRMKMPFGKHEGWLLADLPVHYLEWFARKGFPKGELGMLLETVLVIKSNGLEEIIAKLKKRNRPSMQ